MGYRKIRDGNGEYRPKGSVWGSVRGTAWLKSPRERDTKYPIVEWETVPHAERARLNRVLHEKTMEMYGH